MTTRIKLRRDTAANWTANNPILALGEAGIETDNNNIKYGDGITPWNDLDYPPAVKAREQGGFITEIGQQPSVFPYDDQWLSSVAVDDDSRMYVIDSASNSIYKITSDEFFANNLNTFNFIYVDGCHEPEYIKRDLENSFAVLEDGGIMWMDDYDGGQTKETFDNFLIEYDGCYNIIHKGYQLAIQKKNPVFTPFFIENTQMETLPSLILDHYVSELNEKRYKDVNNEISILSST